MQKQRDFYENNKELIKQEVRIKYLNLSPEGKVKRSEYAKNWYNNLPDDKKNIKREYGKKQKYKEYQKNYQKIYQEKKKQELETIKKAQGNLNKMQSQPLKKS